MKKKPTIWIRKAGVKNVKFARVLGQKGKLSQFQKQFQIKQAIKAFYGNISENTFKKTYLWNDDSNQFNILERRLDVLIYRMGFSSSIKESRYLIKSGLVSVNGNKINRQAYNYHVSIGSAIEVSDSCNWAKLNNTLSFNSPRELAEGVHPSHIKLGSKLKTRYIKKESMKAGLTKDTIGNLRLSLAKSKSVTARVTNLVQKYKKSSVNISSQKSLAFLLSNPEDSKVLIKL
jgi:ribosomal protein S4